MAKAIEVEFDDGSTVMIPVDDVRWLAGELRRIDDGMAAVSAAVILERAVEAPRGEPNARFTAEENAVVHVLLHRRQNELSEPLRRLRDGLRDEIEP